MKMCFDGLEAGKFESSATSLSLKDSTGRLRRASIAYILAEKRLKAVKVCSRGSTSRK